MLDGPRTASAGFTAPDPETAVRPDRPSAIGFVTDPVSEAALREGLSDALQEALEVRRGGIRTVIAALQRHSAPRVLVVDISGEDQPVSSLTRLSEVVEPDTTVLAIGESADLGLYRELTDGLGVGEYLVKPLTRDLVARHFAPIARGTAASAESPRGGRFVAVVGVRGGVGASVIAASLAWYFGMIARRHTMLLDSDLFLGTAAFLLDAEPTPGLRMALEAPGRIDALLAERAAMPVADRLHVLSGQEPLVPQTSYVPGAALQLMDALRKRYNFIVGDVRWQPLPLCAELLGAARQRVLVLTPTLAAARDALRMAAGSAGQQRPTLVLNRLGMRGGLKRGVIEEALGVKVDLVIPDMPRLLGQATTMGDSAVAQNGTFRKSIAALAALTGAAAPVSHAAGTGFLGSLGFGLGRGR